MFSSTDKREYTTTNESASPEPFSKTDTKTAMVVVRNVGSKTATFNLQGSVDGEHWVDLFEAEDLAEGKSKSHAVTDYWPHIQVVAKSKESSKSTKLAVSIASIAA